MNGQRVLVVLMPQLLAGSLTRVIKRIYLPLTDIIEGDNVATMFDIYVMSQYKKSPYFWLVSYSPYQYIQVTQPLHATPVLRPAQDS